VTRQQIQFLRRVTPSALQSERDFEIPACVTIAQAVLESATPLYGWGSSRLFRMANNPFGIKASHARGLEQYGHFEAQTMEFRATARPGERSPAPGNGNGSANGGAGHAARGSAAGVQPQLEAAQFQCFPSLAEAFAAHARLLMTPRYGPAYTVRHDWKQFAERLGPKQSANDTDHCEYSTNPGYSVQLIKIVETCHLYDHRAQEWLETGKDPGPILEAMLS
jgi:flagellum-specific peptidoglycan hydrolase FlgJ